MIYTFHPAAESEYLETIAYFEFKQPGLGVSFFAEFEKLLDSVCESPERYKLELGSTVRVALMTRFPYSVHYRTVSGAVQVLAVAHQRRRPNYWLGRL
ncbi:MAG: type II toxin-antitoxin system RelE/ParE family toxin [Candidatus Hydrogenedentes bacterium]|nr:type II toxin-antitoxin system RelE/ParE family toxin [Candidatus Hydrogenedentota bacterium]